MVLVHGWAMSSAAFAPVVEPLTAGARVITLDLRGHGASTTGGGQDLASHAHDLERAFDALDLRDAVLVGWSMGGQIALEAWPALAGRVAGLALVGVTPRFTSAPDWAHGLLPASVEALAARLRHRFQPTLRRFFDAMFTPDELPEPERRALADAVLGESTLTPATALAGLEALLSRLCSRRINGRASRWCALRPCSSTASAMRSACRPPQTGWSGSSLRPGAGCSPGWATHRS